MNNPPLDTTPKGDLCSRCKKNPAEALHSCPYQEEINDDHDPEHCDCCSECTYECAQDI